MRRQALNKVFHEAHRFLEAVNNLKAVQPQTAGDYTSQRANNYIDASKLTAAVRRASMDLTRALAELRKP